MKTQQIISNCLHSPLHIATEDAYNKMNIALTEFGNQIFKLIHMSYYTQQDIDILDECGTIANVGLLTTPPKDIKYSEIDISKAYTASFMEITTVPVFNEFDRFEPFNSNTFKNIH